MKTYVSSDRHIGHKNILKYDNRPFKNIDEHDDAIINIINATVKEWDRLIFLWDAFLCGITRARKYLSLINCQNISFTAGNHDWRQQRALFKDLGRTDLGLLHEDKELKVVLSHYPIQEWRNKHNWWRHYHWHSHHKLNKIKWRQDCTLNFSTINKPLLINKPNANRTNGNTWWIPISWQNQDKKATKWRWLFQRFLDGMQTNRTWRRTHNQFRQDEELYENNLRHNQSTEVQTRNTHTMGLS